MSLLYGDDLKNIFYQIYTLAHEYGIAPDYVESLPPADRDVFILFAEQEAEEARKAASEADKH